MGIFKKFFGFWQLLVFCFLFCNFFSCGFSEDLNNTSMDVVLKAVRNSISDLVADVYLYETVLFNPENFFDFEDVVGSEINNISDFYNYK